MLPGVNEKSGVGAVAIGKLQAGLLVLLLLYVAYLSAQLVWYFVDTPANAELVLSELNQKSTTSKSKKYDALPGLHLFGEAGVKPVAKAAPAVTAPKTRLRLMLKGVFTSENASESSAIIEEIGRSAEYYRVGDKVPGNATLEEVYSDRVLLRRAGKLETLAFDEKQTGGAGIAKVAQKPKSRASRSNEIDSPERFIEEATQRLAEDPEKALNSVGLARGENGGYVYQGKNPMLAGMNLKKGDVIMSVNGHTLGDVQKDKGLMKSLYEQGTLEVEVVRDGASFYVSYPLR